jgi:homopolymeric O-antigen transport system ATP-binding protein
MSNVVVRAEGIGKRYRLGERERYLALRDVLAGFLRSPARLFASRNGNLASRQAQHIWAIKDISFEVKEGEVIGIIGRNGAGKTTLLKILARITKPTEGWAEVRGRMGSLLEVGTGFHPELTGRENVYLSGAILGMRKAEIQRKFDEIVSFAEVEEFLDTPVKHYSTGMQTRLAFSVAAHLEPEILLVDEVLAVGDLQFQKKCLGQMEQLSHGGRTVVFVSHQMNQIRRLCQKVIWVEEGQFRRVGPTAEVVGAYEAAMASGNSADQLRTENAKVRARFLRWRIGGSPGEQPNILDSLGPVRVEFTVEVRKPVRGGVHGIGLYSADGQLMWGTAAYNLKIETGIHQFVYVLPGLPLRPGPYTWRVSLYDDSTLLDAWDCSPEMMVCAQPVTHPRDEWAGVLNIPSQFRIEPDAGQLPRLSGEG